MAYRESHVRTERIEVPLPLSSRVFAVIWLVLCGFGAFTTRDPGRIVVGLLFALVAPAMIFFLRARAFDLVDDNGNISIHRLGPGGWRHILTTQRDEILAVEIARDDDTSRIVLRMRDGRTEPLESIGTSDGARGAVVERIRAFLS